MSSALAGHHLVSASPPQLELVAPALDERLAKAAALLEAGDVDAARAAFSRVLKRADAEGDDVARAESRLGLGTCLYHDGDAVAATETLSLALMLCRDSAEETQTLQARILDRRSRCHRRERHWGAARADVDAGLALVDAGREPLLAARLTFQASLIAERTGQTIVARCLAEQAHDLLIGLDDRRAVGRVLNNLGGLNHLIGDDERAVTLLEQALAAAIEADSEPDAAQALSSLAQVEVTLGLHEQAQAKARQAISILEGRSDFAEELGNATLVLARALRGAGNDDEAARESRRAGAIFGQLGHTSAVAATLVFQGDLARDLGNSDAAATFYRDAAERLQDFRF